MAVPDAIGLEDFLAALRLWRWQRRMAGRPLGTAGPGCVPTLAAGTLALAR